MGLGSRSPNGGKVRWASGNAHRKNALSVAALPAHLAVCPLLGSAQLVSPFQQGRRLKADHRGDSPLTNAAMNNLRPSSSALGGGAASSPEAGGGTDEILLAEKRVAATDTRLAANRQKQYDHLWQRMQERGRMVRETWSAGGHGQPSPLVTPRGAGMGKTKSAPLHQVEVSENVEAYVDRVQTDV